MENDRGVRQESNWAVGVLSLESRQRVTFFWTIVEVRVK